MKTPVNLKHKKTAADGGPRPWTPRRIALAAGLVVAILGVGLGGWWGWLQTQPLPEPRTAEEALANLGSDRFNRMPEMRQDQYLQKTGSLMRDLPRDERRALRERYRDSERVRETMAQRFQQMLVDRALAYNNATPAEREQMMQPRRGRGDGEGRRGRNGGEASGDGGNRRDRMESWMETGNPQTGGLIGERFRHRRSE